MIPGSLKLRLYWLSFAPQFMLQESQRDKYGMNHSLTRLERKGAELIIRKNIGDLNTKRLPQFLFSPH